MRLALIIFISGFFFSSCADKEATPPKVLTKEEMISVNIDSLKRTAINCDMIVREGDDWLSEQIRYMNEVDNSYSHSGLIIEKNGQKMVCHIAPGLPPSDTIQYTPIDSFISTTQNNKCALYRFDLTQAERDSVVAIIDNFKKSDVRFDRSYRLSTDDEMYCTEMIYRALTKATGNRINPKLSLAPKRMHKMLAKYFKELKLTPAKLAKWDYIAIDQIYMIPQAKLVMAFPLKYFPGQ